MTDEPEMIYVYHSGLDAYAWIPKTAQRQHGLQGYVQVEPPAPPARNADGTLAEEIEDVNDVTNPTATEGDEPPDDESNTEKEED